ncbi:MAG: DUF3500 domain-containing protein [Proteobacteria bacterium]|nr:DUF3500 domain-containing protein [Pseudomonadota bacterium]
MNPNRVVRLTQILTLVIASLVLQATLAQQTRVELTQELVDATTSFMRSLTPAQRNDASYQFEDDERFNWHFIPRDRRGIALKDLDKGQLEAARGLLQTLFSAKGFEKTEAVRSLESVLAAIEVNGRFIRDPDDYYLTVFGGPALDGDWAVRYEGHHLAFNWTFIGGMGIASSPQFFGTNPAEVREGPQQGLRVLATEEDMARSLVTSLNPSQSSQAILDTEVPRDIFTAAGKEVTALDDVGVSYSALDASQQRLLMSLIEEIASIQPDVIAHDRLQSIHADGLENIKFAWIGGTERGASHYYRVQGPEFLIEYDNTQNDANHIHLVWRDFAGDFGRDLIRLHYNAVALTQGPGHQH